ncbi:MAG: hypothetical protein ACRDOL_32855 [Streptosporangiaceae bacterium]
MHPFRRATRSTTYYGRQPIPTTQRYCKAAAAKQAFYLAGVEADALGRSGVDAEHVLLGVLRDAEAPARWTRRTRRVRAVLGFPPQPGPHPVLAVIEARGLTVGTLREAILAELHATT